MKPVSTYQFAYAVRDALKLRDRPRAATWRDGKDRSTRCAPRFGAGVAGPSCTGQHSYRRLSRDPKVQKLSVEGAMP